MDRVRGDDLAARVSKEGALDLAEGAKIVLEIAAGVAYAHEHGVTHANIKLPGKLDRILSYVFVTPDMHKFHHHYRAPWTDSNFGNVFSIWDRMFGTLVYADTSDIRYGLDVMNGDTHRL